MTLAEQIERLRNDMMAAHERETKAARALGDAMLHNDVALMRAMQDILTADGRRRRDIAQAFDVLASRIGYTPQLASSPVGQIIETPARLEHVA